MKRRPSPGMLCNVTRDPRFETSTAGSIPGRAGQMGKEKDIETAPVQMGRRHHERTIIMDAITPPTDFDAMCREIEEVRDAVCREIEEVRDAMRAAIEEARAKPEIVNIFIRATDISDQATASEAL
jgi:hypothetical protein